MQTLQLMQKQDYIIIDTPFQTGLYLIQTDEQLEQAIQDPEIIKYNGTISEAKEIIELQKLLNTIENDNKEEDYQRIEQLKLNIKMMIRKEH